jgi:hypothetical protein
MIDITTSTGAVPRVVAIVADAGASATEFEKMKRKCTRYTRRILMPCGICLMTASAFASAQDTADVIAAYDYDLCVTAQRMLLNSQDEEVEVIVERAAVGGGFGILQMDIDTEAGTVIVASLTEQVEIDGEKLDASVWCKLVNQQRVNDVLEKQLAPPPQSCRNVNEHTYQKALALLTDEQRDAYEANGMPLHFIDDYNAGAGAAWIPAVVNDYIEPDHGALRVQAPSVQVPWDPVSRDWYKGTHHCKVITLAAVHRWMTDAAFDTATELFPRANPVCTEPSSMTSTVGSCLQFFGPANATICTDYSGSGWTTEAASAQCSERHATEAAWIAAERRYTGVGGVFSAQSCDDRDAISEAQRPPIEIAAAGRFGTCVFRCNHGDETLWHSLTENLSGGAMTGRCDLFIPAAN